MKIEEKAKLVDELKEELSRSKGFWITDFTCLPVEAMIELRRKLRDSSFVYLVVKKSIFERALQKLGVPPLDEWMDGSVGICRGDDIVLGCRLLTDFQKSRNNFKIKGCWFEGKSFSLTEIRKIIMLPGREVLMTNLLTTLSSPLYRLVQVLHSLLVDLVQVLAQIKEK